MLHQSIAHEFVFKRIIMRRNGSNTIQLHTEVPPINLGDMPVRIAEQIIVSLDAMTKRSLRLTNKDLRSVVDCSPVTYHEVKLTLVDNAPEIHIEMLIDEENRLKLEFLETDTGCLIKNPLEAWEKQELSPDRDCFIKKASEHFVKIFQGARTTVKNLVFIFNPPIIPGVPPLPKPVISKFMGTHRTFLNVFKKHLNRLDHRLKVKHVKFENFVDNMDSVAKLLPFLEPGTLEKITWLYGADLRQEQVIQLKQFQRADVFVTDDSFKPDDFGHFKHIHFVYATRYSLPINLSRLLSGLRTLNAAWKTVQYDFDERIYIDLSLSEFIDETPMAKRRQNSPKHLKILNTDDFMKIEVLDNTVLITKVNFL